MKYNSFGQKISKKESIAVKKSVTRVMALLMVLVLCLDLPGGIKSFAGTSTNGVYSAQIYYGIYKEIRFDAGSRLTNAAGGGITLVANGSKAYGSAELYTNISGTYYFTPDDKGKVKSAQSKVVCVITESKDKPGIEGKGDSSKGATASAKIKN